MFSVQTGVILNAIKSLLPFLSKADPNPVQNSIYCEIGKDSIVLIAFNASGISVKRTLDNVRVENAGIGKSVSFYPASRLVEILKPFDAQEIVTFKFQKDTVSIAGSSKKASVPCLKSDTYPYRPNDFVAPLDTAVYDIDASVFQKAVALGAFLAMGADAPNPVFTGAKIGFPHMSVVSTDGYSAAAYAAFSENDDDPHSDTVIVPTTFLHQIVDIIQATNKDAPLSIVVTDKKLYIESDKTVITCSLLAGKFINLSQVFSQEYVTSFSVPITDLVSALSHVSHFSDRCLLTISEKQVQFSAVAAENGEGSDVIKTKVAGDLFSITLDSNRVLTHVTRFKQMGATQVELQLGGTGKPIIFMPDIPMAQTMLAPIGQK